MQRRAGETVFCSKCGREAFEGERFCARCGTPLTRTGTSAKKKTGSAATAAREKDKNALYKDASPAKKKQPVPRREEETRKKRPPAPPARPRPRTQEAAREEPGWNRKLKIWFRRRVRAVKRTYRRLRRKVRFSFVLVSRRFRLCWRRLRLKTRAFWARTADWWRSQTVALNKRFSRTKRGRNARGRHAPPAKRPVKRPPAAAKAKERPGNVANGKKKPVVDIFELKPSQQIKPCPEKPAKELFQPFELGKPAAKKPSEAEKAVPEKKPTSQPFEFGRKAAEKKKPESKPFEFGKTAPKKAEAPAVASQAAKDENAVPAASMVVEPPQKPARLVFPWEVEIDEKRPARGRPADAAPRSKQSSAGKAKPAPKAAEGKKPAQPAASAAKRPASRAESAPPRKTAGSRSASPGKRPGGRAPQNAKRPGARPASPNKRRPAPPRNDRARRNGSRAVSRSRRYARESFMERHLRSVIAMALLIITLILALFWCTNTPGGQRLFAELGLGNAAGYKILGDECMASGNYARAVEHYYKALTKDTDYEAAIKLARAYRLTGDTEREISALLLCIDQFENNREPYERLKQIYPIPSSRPTAVKDALVKGVTIFSDISMAY